MIKYDGIRYCKICNKEIEVYIEKFSGCKSFFGYKTKNYIQSHEGVLFNKNVWFCNDCWEKILEGIYLK